MTTALDFFASSDLASASLFAAGSPISDTTLPCSSSTARAPGCCLAPLRTARRSSRALASVTRSGTERRTAKYGGMPTSRGSRRGSGEMTERAA